MIFVMKSTRALKEKTWLIASPRPIPKDWPEILPAYKLAYIIMLEMARSSSISISLFLVCFLCVFFSSFLIRGDGPDLISSKP